VDLDHLSLFKDIVSHRSISRGAKEHGVTQSAASQAVQELERVLDIRLLDRSRRPLEVTEAGKLFHEFARDVLRRQQRFRTELEELREEPGGIVRIASIYSVGLSEMSRLEKAFHSRLPQGLLEVDYLRPERVYEAVLEDRADLGLVSYPESGRELVVLDWREEPMVLAAAPSHPLARLTRIRVGDLDQAEFIGFDDDLPISHHIERFLREAGVQVRQRLHFDNIQSMKEALLTGQAVAILPAPMLCAETADGRLRSIKLSPSLNRPLGIVHRRRPLARAVQVFLDVLRNPSVEKPAA
jgi:LysR family transcriptional regulator, transcriptional activator of the cysJI operon